MTHHRRRIRPIRKFTCFSCSLVIMGSHLGETKPICNNECNILQQSSTNVDFCANFSNPSSSLFTFRDLAENDRKLWQITDGTGDGNCQFSLLWRTLLNGEQPYCIHVRNYTIFTTTIPCAPNLITRSSPRTNFLLEVVTCICKRVEFELLAFSV